MLVNPFPHGMIMHIGPNGSYPLGRPEHWDMWISELKAMGFDGVKALVFADADQPAKVPIQALRKCLNAGLVVVCRLFRERPNPGILTEQQIAVAKLLISMGVTLLEVNNEPNLNAEWQGGDFGNMAREVVARNWLTDARRIVELGGYPAIPAMSPGGNLDDGWFLDGVLAEIAKGITPAILDRTWIAVHNYSLNHPLDYPDDEVNRKGAQLTAAQYAASGPWALPLAGVNEARSTGKHTTGSIMDPGESNGWRKSEMAHQGAALRLGVSLPVIATEGGPVMDGGFSNDPRYAMVMTEESHAAIAVESARRMMWGETPEWFWAICPWIMANRQMENPAQAGFEAHSWYPYWKPQGIRAVQAFKDMPKQVRPTGITPQPGVPADELVEAVKERLATFPWGDKEAWRRGYLPVGPQVEKVVGSVKWFCRLARKLDGKLVLLAYREGQYTPAETVEIPFNL